MRASIEWHERSTIVVTAGGDVVIHCATPEAARSIHDHVVASFNASAAHVEDAAVWAEVDGEYIALGEVDEGLVAALDPAEARALAALLLKLADEVEAP